MAVGRLLRECPEAIERIKVDGALAYILEDNRMISLPVEPHRNWLSNVLGEMTVQELSKVLAVIARAIGGEVLSPWRD
jgi:hypothetical protein